MDNRKEGHWLRSWPIPGCYQRNNCKKLKPKASEYDSSERRAPLVKWISWPTNRLVSNRHISPNWNEIFIFPYIKMPLSMENRKEGHQLGSWPIPGCYLWYKCKKFKPQASEYGFTERRAPLVKWGSWPINKPMSNKLIHNPEWKLQENTDETVSCTIYS